MREFTSMRAVLSLLFLLAQAGASFDVVSIKPADDTDATIRGTAVRGNRWIGHRMTLREVIRDAYRSGGLDMPDRVLGGPDWIDKDQFDITAATASQLPPQTPAQLEPLVRAMLRDRFHLRSHVEKRPLSAYEFVLARRDGTLGPKLHRIESDCGTRCGYAMRFGPPNSLRSDGIEMARLAFALSTIMQKPVIDRTGLAGTFALTVEFAPDIELPNAVPSDLPSLFTALEEQLGLRLRSIKEPLDVLVVDSAEKPAF